MPTWHHAHIEEQYALFTIIVLGESFLAATVAIQSVVDSEDSLTSLGGLIVGTPLIVFATWWTQFPKALEQSPTRPRAGVRLGLRPLRRHRRHRPRCHRHAATATAVRAGVDVATDNAVSDCCSRAAELDQCQPTGTGMWSGQPGRGGGLVA